MLEHLRGLREDRDLSQAEMAEILNVHQTTYSAYELETVNLPNTVLRQLALFFDTSTDYLLGLTEEKRAYTRKSI